jgi:hypothetical protein
MSIEAYEPTLIDETTRIAYYYDNHAQHPAEWWDSETLSIHSLYSYVYRELSFGKDPDADTLDDIWCNNDRYGREEAIERHFARKGQAYYILHDEHGISLWYATATNINTNPDLDWIMSHVQEWEAYSKGKVYLVSLEKRVTYRNDDDPNDVRYDWVNHEAIGGLMSTTHEALEYEAKDCFGLHTDLKVPEYSSQA